MITNWPSYKSAAFSTALSNEIFFVATWRQINILFAFCIAWSWGKYLCFVRKSHWHFFILQGLPTSKISFSWVFLLTNEWSWFKYWPWFGSSQRIAPQVNARNMPISNFEFLGLKMLQKDVLGKKVQTMTMMMLTMMSYRRVRKVGELINQQFMVPGLKGTSAVGVSWR